MKTEIIAFNLGFRFKPGLTILAPEIDAVKEHRKVLIDSRSTFICTGHGKPFPVEATVFPDETHMSCVPAAWMRAFSVLYKK